MNKIIKKLKLVNNINLFAKLLGLVLVFNLASCGCEKNDKKEALTVELKPDVAEVKAGAKEFNLKLSGKSGEGKLSDYKVKVTCVCYTDEDYKTKAGNSDLTLKDVDSKTLNDIFGKDDFKKGDSELTKKIEIVVPNASTSKSAEFTIEAERVKKDKSNDQEEVAGDKVTAKVKWTTKQ